MSRKDVLRAQELGTEAGRILSRKGSAGRIFASFSGCIYFLTDDQEVFWVCTEQSLMHRRCIRTESLPVRRLIQPGQRFHIVSPLIAGDSFTVDLRGAQEWNPLLPQQVSSPALVIKKCEQLSGFFQCLNPDNGLSPLIPILWGQGKEIFALSRTAGIFSKMSPAIFEIAKACRGRNLAGVLEKGKELIGLGPGLTPSGDDFMGGFLFSAFALKKFYPEDFFWDLNQVKTFLVEAKSRTHPLSYVFLSDLASGHAPAPLGEALDFLIQERDFEQAASAAVQLLRFGHSTGGDMLAGMMTGMLMV